MADKNCILSFCMIGLFCSMVFSENDILWDFGVIIKQPDLHDSSKKIFYQSRFNLEPLKSSARSTFTRTADPIFSGSRSLSGAAIRS